MLAEDKILEFINRRDDWTVAELVKKTGISRQLIHRILKRLVEDGSVLKLGLPPKTIYRKNHEPKAKLAENPFSIQENDFLKNNFLYITETGEYQEGYVGFANWCLKRKLPVPKTFKEFYVTKQKYLQYYNADGLIDGTDKLKNTKGFEAIFIDKLYYLDFYAIERFGKTILGTILHFAKQGQNKYLMNILLKEIKAKIEQFILQHKFEAIGYVPPTIKRELQLMQFIKNNIDIKIPLIEIYKISGIIPVPQKSLNNIEDRISNADKTFAVFDGNHYNKILLIDDAVGSGATLNQIAKKIKENGIAKKITGLAVVGSFKGFDVISDV